MISAQVASEVRAKITGQAHNVSYYDPAGLESLETPGTSQIVTADASGMAISLTTTVNLLFGSQLCVPETGVIMNDEMVSMHFSHHLSPLFTYTKLTQHTQERLLRPRHLQCLRLRPLPRQLHPPRQTPALLHFNNNSRAPLQRDLLLRHRRGRRLAHHHRHNPEPVERARPWNDYRAGPRAAQIARSVDTRLYEL